MPRPTRRVGTIGACFRSSDDWRRRIASTVGGAARRLEEAALCSPLPLVGSDCSSPQALRRQESLYYSPAAQLETYMLPGNYGHSFNYAQNANLFSQFVAGWAERKVGR